jgi:hypothetical protein
VPLVDGSDLVGVLVLQRTRPVRFTHADVALASSLTAAFSVAMQRRPPTTTLDGEVIVEGTALGRAILLGDAAVASWRDALELLEVDLIAAMQRLRYTRTTEIARALDNLTLVTYALRDHASDDDALSALERVPFRTASGALSLATLVEQRRAELRDLARLFARSESLAGAVIVVPRIGALLALCLVARNVAAVICAGSITHDPSEILRAAGIPTLAAIAGLDPHAGAMLDVDAVRGRVRVADL